MGNTLTSHGVFVVLFANTDEPHTSSQCLIYKLFQRLPTGAALRHGIGLQLPSLLPGPLVKQAVARQAVARVGFTVYPLDPEAAR